MFGQDQMVYVGLELTKKNEAHYCDTVTRLLEHFQEISEGTKLKGEATIVIGPSIDDSKEDMKDFDVLRDSEVRVDVL